MTGDYRIVSVFCRNDVLGPEVSFYMLLCIWLLVLSIDFENNIVVAVMGSGVGNKIIFIWL